MEQITVNKQDLQQLVENFYEACELCDELNIYEWDEGDESMQKMKIFVNERFGRKLENI